LKTSWYFSITSRRVHRFGSAKRSQTTLKITSWDGIEKTIITIPRAPRAKSNRSLEASQPVLLRARPVLRLEMPPRAERQPAELGQGAIECLVDDLRDLFRPRCLGCHGRPFEQHRESRRKGPAAGRHLWGRRSAEGWLHHLWDRRSSDRWQSRAV
jgi:hypothetical protein